jgi:GT2 family glycosyltransferase
MVRSSLFKKIGYFDETYIDSWTEADFGALAIKYGNRVVRVGSAETYHQVNPEDWNGLSVRSIGDNSVKAYTTIKNRYKFVGKYFSRTQKIVFLLFWSWAILCVYIICALKLGKKEYVPIYLRGVRDGLLLI